MTNYYFQFSNGSYSDYSVNGFYICGHEVTAQEWEEHYKAYQDLIQKHEEAAIIAFGKRVGCGHEIVKDYNPDTQWIKVPVQFHNDFYRSGDSEYTDHREWRNALPSPEKTFQELHGMDELEVTECWRD